MPLRVTAVTTKSEAIGHVAYSDSDQLESRSLRAQSQQHRHAHNSPPYTSLRSTNGCPRWDERVRPGHGHAHGPRFRADGPLLPFHPRRHSLVRGLGPRTRQHAVRRMRWPIRIGLVAAVGHRTQGCVGVWDHQSKVWMFAFDFVNSSSEALHRLVGRGDLNLQQPHRRIYQC